MSLEDFDFEFEKTPSENEIIGINFSRRIPPGATVSSYDVIFAALQVPKIDMSFYEPLVITDIDFNATTKILTCICGAGAANFDYRVSFFVTLSDTQVKQDDILVKVRERE